MRNPFAVIARCAFLLLITAMVTIVTAFEKAEPTE